MIVKRKHVLLICSSNTIGFALCKYFDRNNWDVSCSHRQKKTLFGEQTKEYQLDLTSPTNVQEFCAGVKSNRKLDAIIFICGVLSGKSLSESDSQSLTTQFTVNVTAQIDIVKNLLDHINDKGRVIFLTSISAFNGSYDPIYAASKSGINGFMKSMAKFCPRGITFNAVAPGLIADTKMAESFSDEDLNRHMLETPTGELNSSDDIGQIIFELCDDKWRNMNGQVIHINGGRYL